MEEWVALARAVKFLGLWDSVTVALLWWLEHRISRLEEHNDEETG